MIEKNTCALILLAVPLFVGATPPDKNNPDNTKEVKNLQEQHILRKIAICKRYSPPDKFTAITGLSGTTDPDKTDLKRAHGKFRMQCAGWYEKFFALE